MKHYLKGEPIIVLELTKEELSYILCGSVIDVEKQKSIWIELDMEGEFSVQRAFKITDELDEVYESIK